MTLQTISEPELDRLEKASAMLLKSEEQLPVLSTLAWDRSLSEKFFKLKGKWNPEPEYPKIDVSNVRSLLCSARKLISGSSPVHLWLHRFADTTETTANLLSSLGTAQFYEHSCDLYGTSNTLIADGKKSGIELAQRIDSLLSVYDMGCIKLEPSEALTANDLKIQLDEKLPAYFGADGTDKLTSSHQRNQDEI